MHLIKTALTAATFVTVAGLTACQSTSATSADGPHAGWKHGPMAKWSPAERQAHMKKMHEMRAVMNRACEGKSGQTISVNVGDKTIQGTCETVFEPQRDAMKRP